MFQTTNQLLKVAHRKQLIDLSKMSNHGGSFMIVHDRYVVYQRVMRKHLIISLTLRMIHVLHQMTKPYFYHHRNLG